MTTTTTTVAAATTTAIRQPLQTLCLVSPPDTGPPHHSSHTPALSTNSSSSASSATSSAISSTDSSLPKQRESTDSWPTAVEALAQRLWDCGRDALGRTNRPQGPLLFTSTTEKPEQDSDASNNVIEEQLCDVLEDQQQLCDGPYVRIERWSSSGIKHEHENTPQDITGQSSLAKPSDQSDDYFSPLQCRQKPMQQRSSNRPSECHYHHRPMDNPFKTMLKQPNVSIHQTKAPYILTPYKPMATSTSIKDASIPCAAVDQLDSCVHCKRGNFLEFCFVNDRCHCSCHKDCPCKPCLDIRVQRSTIRSVAAYKSYRESAISTGGNSNKRPVGYLSGHGGSSPPKVSRVWNEDPKKHAGGLCSTAS